MFWIVASAFCPFVNSSPETMQIKFLPLMYFHLDELEQSLFCSLRVSYLFTVAFQLFEIGFHWTMEVTDITHLVGAVL